MTHLWLSKYIIFQLYWYSIHSSVFFGVIFPNKLVTSIAISDNEPILIVKGPLVLFWTNIRNSFWYLNL
jgi:hypothetical protein